MYSAVLKSHLNDSYQTDFIITNISYLSEWIKNIFLDLLNQEIT